MSAPTIETRLVSFDGGVAERVRYQRPDRYRDIDAPVAGDARIARGGGYSYAAASFGRGSVVQDMRRFNRILAFDPVKRLIEVEAGATLGEVLDVTSRAGLALPVQPGYPAITVGGCIAANVHGKNPLREHTFAESVDEIVLFHPAHGFLRLTPADPSGIFDLTCGGFGLTGIIVSARLRLWALASATMAITRIPISTPVEALPQLEPLARTSAFAYTWHDAVPSKATFGRGFIYHGRASERPLPARGVVEPYRRLTPEQRATLPVSLWRDSTARMLTSAFWHLEHRRRTTTEVSVFDAMFPFAARSSYFRLFGRPGLLESQLIVPSERAGDFLSELQDLVLSMRAPALMLSMKAFRGVQRWLRFEGDGVCVTLDLRRAPGAVEFLRRLDDLGLRVGAIPNIIKDSRLPRRVVDGSYPGADEFRARLRDFDGQRSFQSELSIRLGL